MHSHYYINVSRDGVHIFGTSPHSLTCKTSAVALTDEFKKRFPESEGFKIELSYCNATYKTVEVA